MRTGISKFKLISAILLSTTLAWVASCEQKDSAVAAKTIKVPDRNFSPEKLVLGKKVYEQYCRTCHGHNGEGTKEWKKRDANGNFPPPPLNGSGHTWHHSLTILKSQIFNGGKENGGVMPAFGDKLNEQEIESVLIWIQSIWPQKTYNAWYEIQHQ